MSVQMHKTEFMLPLSQTHWSQLQNHLSNNLFSRVYRVYTYLIDNTIKVEKDVSKYLEYFVKGAAVTMVVTGVCFHFYYPSTPALAAVPAIGQLATQKDPNESSNSKKGLATWIKAGIVFAGGLMGGAVWTARHIEFDITYRQWKGRAIQNKVYSQYEEALRGDNDFDDLLCTLSLGFCQIPMRDQDGVLYEKEAIERWIDTANANTRNTEPHKTCPRRIRNLQKSDLKYDPTYHPAVLKIIEQKIKNTLNEQYKAGLLSYKISTIKDREELYKAMTMEWNEMFGRGEMNNDQLAEGIKTIQEFYKIEVLPAQPNAAAPPGSATVTA